MKGRELKVKSSELKVKGLLTKTFRDPVVKNNPRRMFSNCDGTQMKQVLQMTAD